MEIGLALIEGGFMVGMSTNLTIVNVVASGQSEVQHPA